MNIVRAVAERGVEAIARVNRWRRRGGESAFLVGVHVPITAEMDLADLRVTGTIPPALRGRYLKMGANPVRPDPASHHWFLGDGMVHGIALEDGRATWYRNRWILSRLAAAALGRPPAPGPRRGRNDTVNTNIVDIGGQTVAVVEAGSFVDSALYPRCACGSARSHGRFRRWVANCPSFCLPVVLAVEVQRFKCVNLGCS